MDVTSTHPRSRPRCSVFTAAAVLFAASCAEGTRVLHQTPPTPTPIVMWHGMGDNCCNPLSMGRLQRYIEAQLPGVYVHSVMVGDSPEADTMHGFFGNVNAQVAEACAALAAEPRLANGFNAVGFSQGGQFMRAVVQRCCGGGGGGGEGLKVKRLITMGGQHQGVASIPGCDTFSRAGAVVDANTTGAGADTRRGEEGEGGGKGEEKVDGSASLFCEAAEAAITTAVYSRYTRSSVVQAQYFKDPAQMSSYLKYNAFLPDINNEKAVKNAAYKANLAALEKLVLIRFTQDSVVVPRDSSWFGTFSPGGGTGAVVPLREQALYVEDWLGLRALDERGALVLSDCPGNHMQFSDEWFKVNVIDEYLRDDAGFGRKVTRKEESAALARARAAATTAAGWVMERVEEAVGWTTSAEASADPSAVER